MTKSTYLMRLASMLSMSFISSCSHIAKEKEAPITGGASVSSKHMSPLTLPPPNPGIGFGSFTIFFDLDKTNINGQSAQVLENAAQLYARLHSQSYEPLMTIDGYADTAGSAIQNLKLSRQRAEAVAAYLNLKGIPASHLRITSFGETHLLIPTPDATRRLENRRVEINFQPYPEK